MQFGAIFHRASKTLDDDIQTYAALQFLPQVDVFIDREALAGFEGLNGEAVAVILNGSFLDHKYRWPPSRFIHPLCTSMHFKQRDCWGLGTSFLDGAGGAWLRQYGPVGCMDDETLRVCDFHRIPHTFSGCLSLCLPRRPREGDGAYICAVDLPEAALAEVGRQVGAHALHVVRTSHALDSTAAAAPMEPRMDRVARQLALYQSARCVVTTRLHAALACLALGVPVLFLRAAEDEDAPPDRLLSLLHTEDPRRFGLGLSGYDIVHPPENSRAFEALRDALDETVRAFVASCQAAAPKAPPAEDAAESESIERFRQNLLSQVADASYEQLTADEAAHRDLAEKHREMQASLGRALAEAEAGQTELRVQRDHLWRQNQIVREVEVEASGHLDAIAKSRSYRLYRTLQAGLRELKSLNPVRWGRFIAAVFARLAGRPARLHRYRLQDPLLQVQRFLSHKANSDIPGYNLAIQNCFVPLDEGILRDLQAILHTIRKHKKVMWILAPLFRDAVLTDGYYRRIKAVDDMLGPGVHRVYLSQLYLADKNLAVPFAVDLDSPGRWEFAYDLENPAHIAMLKTLLHPADTFYSHSVEQISAIATDGAHTGPLFVDMHGISPEERAMQGDMVAAQRAGDQEAFVAKHAHRIVVVTGAMGQHYREKYPELKPDIITMPILETAVDLQHKTFAARPLEDGKPVVVYAGALQEWQQIGPMQNAISARRADCAYRIFTSQPEEFMEMWGTRPQPAQMTVGTRSVQQLKKEYESCHYGFALREDTAVNRVSCPTKLVEYLEYGIVPILQTPNIGDFVALGMAWLPLEDFLQGKLPTEAERVQMAQSNLAVLGRLNALFESGRAALLAALDIGKGGRT
ncbi:MAG: polysaccharide pyruvyl transferase family protein [Oscillospiraceae bacterium]